MMPDPNDFNNKKDDNSEVWWGCFIWFLWLLLFSCTSYLCFDSYLKIGTPFVSCAGFLCAVLAIDCFFQILFYKRKK
jgi:hypothetical protein